MTAPEFDLSGLDPEQLGRVMDALAGSDVEECELAQGEMSVSIRRRIGQPEQPAGQRVAAEEGQPAEVPAFVRASAVGVFTRSDRLTPAPGGGLEVKAGDVVGSIEVLGVPHAVLAAASGVLEEFMVEDGEPVEYGQPLATIRPITRELGRGE